MGWREQLQEVGHDFLIALSAAAQENPGEAEVLFGLPREVVDRVGKMSLAEIRQVSETPLAIVGLRYPIEQLLAGRDGAGEGATFARLATDRSATVGLVTQAGRSGR
jgi:hypothetical protein